MKSTLPKDQRHRADGIVALLEALHFGDRQCILFFTNQPVGGEGDWGYFGNLDEIDDSVVRSAGNSRPLLMRSESGDCVNPSGTSANGTGFTLEFARWCPHLKRYEILAQVMRTPGATPERQWYPVAMLREIIGTR